MKPPENTCAGEPQLPKGFGFSAPHRAFCLSNRVECPAGMIVKCPAILGQRQRAGGSVKKDTAEMLFKNRDLTGNCRLRCIEITRNGSEGACFDRPHEGPKEEKDIAHSFII
ncbi:hypothetical protein GCM10011497_37700 [Elstera cyanobacteriorum]|nr:hypothetical protein GCM10011497_37700 [Elstera cyanobacteriorum]